MILSRPSSYLLIKLSNQKIFAIKNRCAFRPLKPWANQNRRNFTLAYEIIIGNNEICQKHLKYEKKNTHKIRQIVLHMVCDVRYVNNISSTVKNRLRLLLRYTLPLTFKTSTMQPAGQRHSK